MALGEVSLKDAPAEWTTDVGCAWKSLIKVPWTCFEGAIGSMIQGLR
jgi:hypothetical protein